jgi:hypothetical protein
LLNADGKSTYWTTVDQESHHLGFVLEVACTRERLKSDPTQPPPNTLSQPRDAESPFLTSEVARNTQRDKPVMRVPVSLFTLLVAIATLLVNVHGATDEKAFARSLAVKHHNIGTKRLLRTGEASDDEERAMVIPGNSKFVKWLNKMNSKSSAVSKADKKQAKTWLKNEESAEGLFNRLRLNVGMDKVLTNPNINAWATFINLYNTKYPDKKVSMIGMLTKHYGDAAVARTLELSGHAKNTKKLANQLRSDQLNAWAADKKPLDEVFSLLKLDKALDELFSTPQLNTLYGYAVKTTKDPDAAVIAVLAGWYGDDILAKIFLVAQPKVRRMRDIAFNLENAMVNGWLKSKLTSEKVFEMLKLDDGLGTLLAQPNLQLWITYVAKFNKKFPAEQTTVVKTLTTICGVKPVSDMLKAAAKVPKTKYIATQWLADLNKQILAGTRAQ